MAETDKDALKAAKEAEKAALKAKQDRIKQSKPKKDGNIFSRLGKNVKKFWKDFTGTCKKIVWPGAKQVLKSSAVVLASIIVVGLVIFGFDRGVGALFSLGVDGAEKLGQQVFTTEAPASEGDTDATTTEPAEEEQTSTEAASEEESTEETTTAADEG